VFYLKYLCDYCINIHNNLIKSLHKLNNIRTQSFYFYPYKQNSLVIYWEYFYCFIFRCSNNSIIIDLNHRSYKIFMSTIQNKVIIEHFLLRFINIIRFLLLYILFISFRFFLFFTFIALFLFFIFILLTQIIIIIRIISSFLWFFIFFLSFFNNLLFIIFNNTCSTRNSRNRACSHWWLFLAVYETLLLAFHYFTIY